MCTSLVVRIAVVPQQWRRANPCFEEYIFTQRIYIYTYIYIHIYIHIHIHIHIYMCVCVCVCINIHIYMYVYLYMCVCVYTCTYPAFTMMLLRSVKFSARQLGKKYLVDLTKETLEL